MTTGIRKAAKYALRKCSQGNECACKKAKSILVSEGISIHAGSNISFLEAVESEEDHPNKLPFRGVLLVVDAASTKPPHGSRGHRIYVPKDVAEKKLGSLIGMAINYDRGDLDSHVTRHKVGIITKAWIKGDQVWVKGFAYKKDFPEVVHDLKQGGLGMSMELANVYVRDENEDVWHLVDFAFTGATILKKSAAAYYQTELVANAGRSVRKTAVAAIAASGKHKGEKGMAEKKKTVAASSDSGQGALLVSAIEGAIAKSFAPVIGELKASNDRVSQLSNDVEELKGLYMIQAAAKEEDDEEMEAAYEEDDEEMEAAGKSKKEDDEDEEDEEDDDEEGEEDDLDASLEKLEEVAVAEDPGNVNKKRGDENKGDKTTITDPPTQREKVPGNIAKGRLKSAAFGMKSSASMQAAAVEISRLYAQLGKAKRLNKQLAKQIKAQSKESRQLSTKVDSLEAQASNWAEMVNRKSVVPIEVDNLLRKGNMDARQIMASGERIPVSVVDNLFAAMQDSGVQVDVLKRAELKNRMYQMGLMESGEMN